MRDQQKLQDVIATVWLAAMAVLILVAVLWLAPGQSAEPPAEQDCVQHGLRYRGLPECDGVPGPGSEVQS